MSGTDDQNDEFFDESVADFNDAFGNIDGRDDSEELGDGAVGAGVLERAMPDRADADQAFIRAAEAQTAIARAAAIAAGRRKGGVAGAALAGAMFAVAEIYEGPRKEKSSVVVEASSDPNDLDADGLEVTVGEVSVAAPALERLEPVSERDRRKRPVV